MPAPRRILTTLWLLLPVAALVWHLQIGRRHLAADRAAEEVAVAQAAVQRGDHREAATRFAAAVAALPVGHPGRDTLEVAQATQTVAAGSIAEGLEALEGLVARLASGADRSLADDARAELAGAHYHAAWRMRLEGAASDEWLIEAEAARQHYRLLAETAPEAEAATRNLESTVRLERMDLSELQGLKLPTSCKNCCDSLSQRRRKQRQSRNQDQSPQKKEGTQDVRQQMREERGAGNGQMGSGGS